MASLFFICVCLLLGVVLFVKTDESLSHANSNHLTKSQNGALNAKVNFSIFLSVLILLYFISMVFLDPAELSFTVVRNTARLVESKREGYDLSEVLGGIGVFFSKIYILFWFFVVLFCSLITLLFLSKFSIKFQVIIKSILFAVIVWPVLIFFSYLIQA